MKGDQLTSPLSYGRGPQKVTLYSPTAALPYYRLGYRLGGKRIQRTLYSGDYSIQGAEHLFAVERKSLDDLAASFTFSRRATFEHELLRLRGHRFRRLLVIGSEEEVLAQRYRSNILPQTLLGSIDSFEMRYDIPVVWTADPDSAAKLIERWAKKFATEITKVSFDVNCVKKPPSPNPVL